MSPVCNATNIEQVDANIIYQFVVETTPSGACVPVELGEGRFVMLILRAMVRGRAESYSASRSQRGPQAALDLLWETKRIYRGIEEQMLSAPRVRPFPGGHFGSDCGDDAFNVGAVGRTQRSAARAATEAPHSGGHTGRSQSDP